MLKIVVANCDGELVNYEWDELYDFLADIDSDNEDIPMLDDELVSVRCKEHPQLNRMKFDDVYDLYDYLRGEKDAYAENYLYN